jgi:hypothetical protein
MINKLLEYAQFINAREEVMTWIKQTVGAAIKKNKQLDLAEMEHVLDYLVSDKAPNRLLKMSITQAKESAKKWSKTNQKKGANLVDTDKDISVLHEYSDGTKIVKLLTESAYKREGFLMSHCLGGYSVKSDTEIYSYRDSKNMPHATLEVKKTDGVINQIKGKGNGYIHPKYIQPIMDFLISIGQRPRPSEMENLGYYHIDPSVLDLIKKVKGANITLTNLYGENYVVDLR